MTVYVVNNVYRFVVSMPSCKACADVCCEVKSEAVFLFCSKLT